MRGAVEMRACNAAPTTHSLVVHTSKGIPTGHILDGRYTAQALLSRRHSSLPTYDEPVTASLRLENEQGPHLSQRSNPQRTTANSSSSQVLHEDLQRHVVCEDRRPCRCRAILCRSRRNRIERQQSPQEATIPPGTNSRGLFDTCVVDGFSLLSKKRACDPF